MDHVARPAGNERGRLQDLPILGGRQFMEFRTSIRADGLDPADDDDKPIEKQVSI